MTETYERGNRMIYLDNASTTKIDQRVLTAMMPYLTDEYGNAGTLYELGRKSADAINDARESVADMIGATSNQIIFTSGGTESNNLAFLGTTRYLEQIGKNHIVTTDIEHDSILNATRKIHEMQSFLIEYVPPKKNDGVDFHEVLDCITYTTGLVSVMNTNNETGLQNLGLEKIGEFCNKNGILFHTDCVQAVGFHELDVERLHCDMMSLSSHKIHGPKGVGALYVRDKSILDPLINGGSSQEFGLRGGTENVAGIVGFGEACKIVRLELENDSKYIAILLQLLYNNICKYLSDSGLVNIVHINGGNDVLKHGKTLNVRFDGVDGETLLLMLDARGVCVSAGSACRSHESKPSHVLLAMGVEAEDARNSVRFSVSRMNSEEEIVEAAKIVADCVNTLYQSS